MTEPSPYLAPKSRIPDKWLEEEPEKHGGAKKVLVIFGAVFIVLIVIGAIAAGVFAYFGGNLDRDSKKYADEVIPLIVANWDASELKRRCSPEFKATVKEEDVDKLFRVLQKLGKLKNYKGSRGQAYMAMTTQQGRLVTAQYVAQVDFESGPAELFLALIKHDGEWEITGFRVNSKTLMPQ
jgi:hypothetical protein